MRILYLVPYAPTPIRARSYNLIRCLGRRGHALTLATTWETEREREWLASLAGDGVEVISARLAKTRAAVNMLGALAANRPLQTGYSWHPALMRSLEARLALKPRPFDVIHVEHLRGSRYGQRIKTITSGVYPRSPIVWDSVDCISLLFEQAAQRSRSRVGRWMTQFELARTRRSEARLVGQFDRVLVSSNADKAALERLAGRNQPETLGAGAEGNSRPLINVLPNGVDLDYFTPSFEERPAESVVVTGKMSYHANVTAALHLVEDVMPQVWARRPAIRVDIVGQAPPSEVRALAQRYAPRVTVTGFVPDVRPYLWSAAVAAAPIVYGAGSQFKVLEAMACATPVVATPQAVAAFETRDGEHVLVSKGPEAMAHNLLRLLDDDVLRRRLGEAGRRYVVDHHYWGTISGKLEEQYRELVGAAV